MFRPSHLVVLGVSGCGNSTLGKALSLRLGLPYVEGDDLHPPANVAKMAAGIPLDDADRRPFIDAVGNAIAASGDSGIVVSCSALKRAYRDRIAELARCDVCFVLPRMTRAQLEERVAARADHFMPPSLLDSQLLAFEHPAADEHFVVVDGAASPDEQVEQVLEGAGRNGRKPPVGGGAGF